MPQPEWHGFGIRLGRAIDRWPGGGQRAFATALAEYAERHGINIPTSYRTLVNYLGGTTHPSAAWVEAAANVLRWNAEYLSTGDGQERPADEGSGLVLEVSGEGGQRTSALMQLFVNRHGDLPMPARLMVYGFLDHYFAGSDLDWTDIPDRRTDVHRVLDEYFGPLLAAPSTKHNTTMALTASLLAAAYIRLGV
jgi:hypothetical protein